MTKAFWGFSRAPLFVQVLALMVVTFLVAQLATLIMVLQTLPRPSPPLPTIYGEITARL